MIIEWPSVVHLCMDTIDSQGQFSKWPSVSHPFSLEALAEPKCECDPARESPLVFIIWIIGLCYCQLFILRNSS